jgi:hypothetical protein
MQLWPTSRANLDISFSVNLPLFFCKRENQNGIEEKQRRAIAKICIRSLLRKPACGARDHATPNRLVSDCPVTARIHRFAIVRRLVLLYLEYLETTARVAFSQNPAVAGGLPFVSLLDS